MPTPRKQTRSNVAKNVNTAPLQDEYGHLQPQDLKLEEAVLGALLVEKNAYYQIADILKPESFYEKKTPGNFRGYTPPVYRGKAVGYPHRHGGTP